MKIDLVPLPPVFDEDRFDSLFVTPSTPTPPTPTDEDDESVGNRAQDEAERADSVPPVEIDFEGIRRRGYLVPTDFSVGTILLSPDGAERVDGSATFPVGDTEGPQRLAEDLLARATPGIAAHFSGAE